MSQSLLFKVVDSINVTTTKTNKEGESQSLLFKVVDSIQSGRYRKREEVRGLNPFYLR